MLRPRMAARVVSSLALAALVFACQDSPNGAPVGPTLAISDGATSGNPDFFFSPPLSDNPSSSPNYEPGTSNPNLMPVARICRLASGECVEDVPPTGGLAMTYSSGETYSVNWKTSDSQLDPNELYRISVFPDAAAGHALGYRDVDPENGPPVANCTSLTAFCKINNGSNIPIKVRIESGALCDPPGAKTCATRTFDLGRSGSLTLGADELFVPAQHTQSGPATVTLQPCSASDSAHIKGLLDIPMFDPCLKTATEFTGTLDNRAIISTCEPEDIEAIESALADPGQLGLVTLFHFGGATGDGSVDALPHASRCPGFASTPQPKSRLGRFAKAIFSWLTPTPLAAIHRGGGGETVILNSFFMFGLPVRTEALSAADLNRIAPVGSNLGVSVKVTDLIGRPVKDATVHFTLGTSSGTGAHVTPVQIITTSTGIAAATWTIGSDPGVSTVGVGGRGHGVPGTDGTDNGPRGASYQFPADDTNGFHTGPTDPWMPIDYTESSSDGITAQSEETHVNIPSPQTDRVVTFTAIGCVPGYGTPNAIDGVLDAGEWKCAAHRDIPVNLSGGSTVTGTLYWMNDGSNLFFAVSVPGTERKNGFRIDFDNNGNSQGETVRSPAEENDDVLEFDPSKGFADKYLTKKCTNSSQSSCGSSDEPQDGDGAFRNDLGGMTVYELSHQLCTEQMVDYCVKKDDPLGLFVSLTLGNGAQGNTQVPGFRQYMVITIK